MKKAELPALATRLITHLQTYPGRNFSAADLLVVLEISLERDLRDVVRFARLEMKKPVISTFENGYKWPEGRDDDEVDHCIKQRRMVGADNFAVAAAIEKGMAREFPAEPVQLTFEEAM